MKRVFLALSLSLAAEYWAFQLHTNHPLVRPAYFHTLLLFIQLSMCWSGIEAARWLLRRSLASTMEGVESDWVRLWLWVGPPGGLLLALACFLGKWADIISNTRLAGPLVVAHLSGGAVAWILAGFWTVPQAVTDPGMSNWERTLAFLGVVSHGLGFLAYFTVYPAATLTFAMLLGSALAFFYLLFYLGATCLSWALIFRFWPSAKPR